MFGKLREIVKYSIGYACMMHCTFEYLGDFVVCNGPSMEPTLFSKDILLTERITTRLQSGVHVKRGDIIIAISPSNPKQFICKRVVGLPGDKIVSTTPTNVPKDDIETKDDMEEIKSAKMSSDVVPRGYVWIEGDNSQNSADSRFYGPIPIGLVKSRVVCRLFPLNEMKLLL